MNHKGEMHMEAIMDLLNINIGQLFLYVTMIVIVWILIRDVKCWYWRINEIVKNQEESLDQMDKVINELNLQNKKLLTLINEVRQQNKTKEEKESTP